MDTRNGDIYCGEQIREMQKALNADGSFNEPLYSQYIKRNPSAATLGALVPLSDKQVAALKPLGGESRKGYMRNQPCVCGSGKKFKKCCWVKYSQSQERSGA